MPLTPSKFPVMQIVCHDRTALPGGFPPTHHSLCVAKSRRAEPHQVERVATRVGAAAGPDVPVLKAWVRQWQQSTMARTMAH